MISFLKNTLTLLILRLIVGGIFVVAAMDKITAVAAFEQAILHYHLTGPVISMLAATVLPWLELICGLSLMMGIFPRSSASILGVLLLFFTMAVLYALVRGYDISCGCFSLDPNAGKIGWLKIIENCVLLLLNAPLLFSDAEDLTVPDLLRKYKDKRKKTS
jgi:uncharacterized membrane protein YphA (DoxX/SURF4 family)